MGGTRSRIYSIKLEEEVLTVLLQGVEMRGRDTWGAPLTSKELRDLARRPPLPSCEPPSLQDGKDLPTPCCPWGCREHPMCVEDSGVLCGTSQLQLHVTPGPKLKHWGERKKPDVGEQSREDSPTLAFKAGKINPRCQNPLAVDSDWRRLWGGLCPGCVRLGENPVHSGFCTFLHGPHASMRSMPGKTARESFVNL